MINIDLARNKGLIVNDDKSLYDEIVYRYKYVLEYYISKVINLKEYDSNISNSNLGIGKNSKYKLLNNYLDLDYIFLINNIFVEKLSYDDLKLFQELFNKDNISDDLINLVKRTYKDVIYDNYFKNEYHSDIYKVCYGPAVPFNMVDNDSLVFKIYYGKNTIDLDGNDFIELHEKQLAYLNNLIKKLINEVHEKLDVKCEILLEKDIYND